MNITQRAKIWIDVIKSFILTFDGIKANIMSAQETVNTLVKEKKSLIRFGDGEFGIYRDKDIHYQTWTPQLKEEFLAIKQDYEKSNGEAKFLLAVPQKFMSVSGWVLMKKRVYVSSWSQSRFDFKTKWNHKICYGDSFLFEKKNKELYSKLWSGEGCPKYIIFIHNKKQYAELFSSTYGKEVEFIECPSKNAFDKVNEIEKQILESIKEKQWDKKDVMVVISAGPAGKVIVYRMCMKQVWAIDAGHCWDDPLEGV